MPRFTLKHLEYFVAAGEAGSVTLAAARVPISPPSVSAAITTLEHEFGVQLFVRHHAQGLSLTTAGARLLIAARDLLRAADDLGDLARDMATGIAGPLRVGAFRTLSSLILPELIAGYAAAHPRVDLTVIEDDEAGLATRLRRGEIDCALSYAQADDDIAFEPLARLPTYIVVPASHALASRDQLMLTDLADEPFILLDMPVSRDYFRSLFNGAGVAMAPAMRSDQPETVRSLVGSGLGWSLMTARPASRVAANGRPLAYVALRDAVPPMQLGLLTNPAIRPTRATAAFADLCRSTITTGHVPGMADLTLA
ncbi:LysR family transcriptional regulator [Novosphingobium sp.]|uniref:LysR family transcriptional regulator n=1 Tax=Novosphingobium sp. TaxID=1874826 RepID=UPI003341FB46